MYFGRLALLSFVFWPICNLATGKSQEVELLQKALHASYKGLQYMENHISEINLDGAFGCRLVEEIFHSFLESRPDIFDALAAPLRNQLEMLSVKAQRIADEAKHYLKFNDPEYYGTLGRLLDESEVVMWYPTRLTKPSLRMRPYPCSEYAFNESMSDQCLQGIIGSRLDRSDGCNLRKECIDMMTKPRQRGYMLTHQVLYFQLVEMRNCLAKSQVMDIPKAFQDELCTNVMRDAEEIANNGYPINHRDLFMEQIGLCGLWGYKDFYKQKWLKAILHWQLQSGCFTNRVPWSCADDLSNVKIRRKREEKILSDGCLSHKTTVALLAMAASIRFNIEGIYNDK